MNREILSERLYTIQNHGYDFFTGTCSDGRQVVMGLMCPHVVAYFFDSNGGLVGNERQLWNYPAPRMGLDGPYRIYDDSFQAALKVQLREWQESIGFRLGPIRVREFLDPQYRVGITLIPDHLEPAEYEKRELDDEERQYLEQDRAAWLSMGQFVWWWAKDYWMDSNGEVEST